MKRRARYLIILTLPISFLIDYIKYKIFKKSSVTALIFHDFSKNDLIKFKRIIHFLHKRFHFISPQEFIQYKSGDLELKGRHLLITFDDGFLSSKEATDKVLAPLKIKALFFCCPNFIGASQENAKKFIASNIHLGGITESEVSASELPMNQDEIKELIQKGHSIGGHTLTHTNLATIQDENWLHQEVQECSSYFQENFNLAPVFFAFPFGGIHCIDQKSLTKIDQFYTYCFSGIRGNITQKIPNMALLRQPVTLQDPYLLQLALFYGGTNFLHIKKRKRLFSLL